MRPLSFFPPFFLIIAAITTIVAAIPTIITTLTTVSVAIPGKISLKKGKKANIVTVYSFSTKLFSMNCLPERINIYIITQSKQKYAWFKFKNC